MKIQQSIISSGYYPLVLFFLICLQGVHAPPVYSQHFLNLKNSSPHTIINKTPFPSHSQKFSPFIHISDQQHGLEESNTNTKTETLDSSQLLQAAIHKIGVMYELGTYVQKDLHKALKWHLRAANLGYASAQSDVGIFYEDGLTGRPNIATAIFWYKKAAVQGDPFAIEALQRLKHEPCNNCNH